MYSQSFSPIELYRCATQTERRDSGLNKEELIKAIRSELSDTIAKGTYLFQIKRNGDLYLNGQDKGTMAFLCQDLILRKLHRNNIGFVSPARRYEAKSCTAVENVI